MTKSGWMRHPVISRLPVFMKDLLIRVRGSASAARYRRSNIGKRTYLDPSVQVLGWANCRIGADCVISEETWIQINFPKDPKCRIEIGSHCFIGRRNFFSVGEGILVGDYCLFGPNCHILGAGHKMERPFVPYAVAGIENYGQVNVGVNCWLTSNVTISRGVTIGYGTVVGANSLVTTSLPPLCLAIGAPARITKLFDIQAGKWMPLPGDDSEESIARHVASLPVAAEYARLISAAGSDLYLARQSAGRFAGEL